MRRSGACRVNERGDVKVADFGLSRDLLLRDYYRSDCGGGGGGGGTTPVPVRWLAPESLDASVFTTMTDVVRTGPMSVSHVLPPRHLCSSIHPGPTLPLAGSDTQLALFSSSIANKTVHTHRASVHQAAKLVATLLRVTASLAKSNGSLPPGL